MLVSPAIDAAAAGVLGLLVGSFLNVVIYRLPKMLERQWADECAQLQGKAPEEAPAFNLTRPRSRCRQCGHLIRWYENVPVLSYLVLRGKCSACATRWWNWPRRRCSFFRSGIGARRPPAAPGAPFRRRSWRWR